MLAELLLASALGSGGDCKATTPKGRPQLFVMIRELSGTPISGVAVTLQAHQGGWKERAVTDRTGDAVFTPPRSGNYRISLICEQQDICSHVQPQQRETISLKAGVYTSTSFYPRPVVIF